MNTYFIFETGLPMVDTGPYLVMKQTRWLAGASQYPDEYHKVRTGKLCAKPRRVITEDSIMVSAVAQVISDGGQIGYAHCMTQPGFYRWIIKIREFLTPG